MSEVLRSECSLYLCEFGSSSYSSPTVLQFGLSDQAILCGSPALAIGLLLTGQIRFRGVSENPIIQIMLCKLAVLHLFMWPSRSC